ncbi:Metallo-dependent phosphatase [Lichtheimia hyalospora FSU 10163]|nr:Metallo-dependent phosphatase [Lichtheimia hyalospora FSU 10163]
MASTVLAAVVPSSSSSSSSIKSKNNRRWSDDGDDDDDKISSASVPNRLVSKYANLTYIQVRDDGALPRRLFAVGDIHGCLDELNELLDTIQYDYASGDRLVLLGDLVAKGPDSAGVVQRARELNAWCVRGNHDDKVVRLATFQRSTMHQSHNREFKVVPEGKVHDPLKLDNHHVHIASRLMMSDNDYEYLAACPMMLALPVLQSLFVHAGLDPSHTLDRQEPFFVMNMRSLQEDGSPAKHRSDGVRSWTNAWEEMVESSHPITPFRNVYYGHAAANRLQLGNHTFGLDSGCVYGGQLSAFDVLTHQLYQVQCKQYAEHD